MANANAVFVGDGSLLIQCAQAWRKRGHAIGAVVTHSGSILEWAQAQGIPTLRAEDVATVDLPGAQFDYLFSIANLYVLPPTLLSRASRLAINFHDAPLPRYAGLHATSWALMAQEDTHGVTWHEMTGRVDAGRIVRQIFVPIACDDTALSLNARCYEAGLASFEQIADDIVRGELALTAQPAGRSWFGRDKRPDVLATLDFSRPAAQLAALVRALDFGPYPNPLAYAKLYLGTDVLWVKSARMADATPGAQPGTVVGTDGNEIRVATAAGDIILGGLFNRHGDAALDAFTKGMVLPALGRRRVTSSWGACRVLTRRRRFRQFQQARCCPRCRSRRAKSSRRTFRESRRARRSGARCCPRWRR